MDYMLKSISVGVLLFSAFSGAASGENKATNRSGNEIALMIAPNYNNDQQDQYSDWRDNRRYDQNRRNWDSNRNYRPTTRTYNNNYYYYPQYSPYATQELFYNMQVSPYSTEFAPHYSQFSPYYRGFYNNRTNNINSCYYLNGVYYCN